MGNPRPDLAAIAEVMADAEDALINDDPGVPGDGVKLVWTLDRAGDLTPDELADF